MTKRSKTEGRPLSIEATNEFWTRAAPLVEMMDAPKVSISIRVEVPLLDFYKKEGKGYQKRMRQVLRDYAIKSAR